MATVLINELEVVVEERGDQEQGAGSDPVQPQHVAHTQPNDFQSMLYHFAAREERVRAH